MLKNVHYQEDVGLDPKPNYATEAELALADELRHQLELRYFGSSFAPTTSPAKPDGMH